MELFELSEEWTMILSLIFLADVFPIISGKGWHFHFAKFCFIIEQNEKARCSIVKMPRQLKDQGQKNVHIHAFLG
jgi:hypothetical protein